MAQLGIARQVEDVVQRCLKVPEDLIGPWTHFSRDLGADSLTLVELTLALEEEFGIDLDSDHVERLATVQDAVEYVARCLERGTRKDPGRSVPS